MRMLRGAAIGAVAGLVLAAPAAEAVHFYRGPAGGCAPAAGALTDDPAPSGPIGAEVMMLHNTFNDGSSALPVTQINVGEAVKWTWNSEHCHSVRAAGSFYSGYHYPSPEPTTPAVAQGLFHYPVPELADTKLSYTHTFNAPGTFTYACEHHAAIGMVGVVVVS